ncbi:MAG TPA: thiopurine S-methyltransferase [Polyangiales bacterium]
MEHAFWHARWQSKQIGFHLQTPNPVLVRWYERALPVAPGSRVFVPLCGKSLDVIWLREQGHRVAGIELSPVAVRELFSEHGLVDDAQPAGALIRHATAGLDVWEGDVFDLDTKELGAVEGYYDRAALVALPPALRKRYVDHVTSLLQPGTRGMLVSFEYQPSEGGPPFSVAEDEVRALYEPGFHVELLERADILDAEPRFRERGITSLYETAYAVVRR